MEAAQYVNKVGKQINDSTKVNAKFDHSSMQNLILYNHLVKVYNKAKDDAAITPKQLNQLLKEINCLKKQIKFYPTKDIDDDCILTEVEKCIIQE